MMRLTWLERRDACALVTNGTRIVQWRHREGRWCPSAIEAALFTDVILKMKVCMCVCVHAVCQCRAQSAKKATQAYDGQCCDSKQICIPIKTKSNKASFRCCLWLWSLHTFDNRYTHTLMQRACHTINTLQCLWWSTYPRRTLKAS